ncbi:hypothetical protein [Paenibacillus silvisoli]|nr:hypothetical protein [Paenibacillus silvisoli]
MQSETGIRTCTLSPAYNATSKLMRRQAGVHDAESGEEEGNV